MNDQDILVLFEKRNENDENADKIIVLDHGLKVEEGTHLDLVKLNGVFIALKGSSYQEEIDNACQAVHFVYVFCLFAVFHTTQNNVIFIILFNKLFQTTEGYRLNDINAIIFAFIVQRIKIIINKRS